MVLFDFASSGLCSGQPAAWTDPVLCHNAFFIPLLLLKWCCSSWKKTLYNMTAFPNPVVLIIDTHSCLNDGHSHHHLWGLLTLTVCYTTVWCTCGTWSWLRFSFHDEPERPIVTWQGCNSCLRMVASLSLPLAIPSSLDDLQGKSHLTIYAIFIKKKFKLNFAFIDFHKVRQFPSAL